MDDFVGRFAVSFGDSTIIRMMTFYRNRETGLVQAHPTPGIGESLNSDEIGEDGKPLAYKPIPAEQIEAHRAEAAKNSDANRGDGDTKKDGDK